MWTGKKCSELTEIRHDFLYVIKNNYWMQILFFILFMVLIPFSTVGLPGDSMFSVEYTHDQVKYRFFHGSVLVPILILALAMGVICGIELFRFLLNKRDTTMYLSLMLTRGKLFLNRALMGCMICVFSLAIPMLLSLWLNRMAVGSYMCQVRDCLYLIWGLCVIALTGFGAAVISCMLAGTVAEAMIYAIGILCAPEMLFYGVNLLAKQFFWGNAWGVDNWLGNGQIGENLLQKFAWANPIMFFWNELKTHYIFIRPNENPVPEALEPAAVIGWTVMVILLLVFAYYLFKIRKAESAGISGTNPVLSEIIIGLTALLSFSLTIYFLGKFSVALGILFGFGMMIVLHLFWRKSLFAYDLNRKRVIGSFAGQTIIAGAICLVFVFWCPVRCTQILNKSDEFTKAEVSFVGSPDYLYTTGAGSSSRGYYVVSRLSFENSEAIQAVAEAQKDFVMSGRKEMKLAEDDFSNTVVPYDVEFSYTDKNGKEYIWYYDRASMTQLENLLSLENQTEIKDKQKTLFTDTLSDENSVIWANEAYRKGSVYLTDSLYQNTWELSLSDAVREELLQAMAEDITNQSFEDRYFADNTAKAVLMFTQNTEYDLQYYSYHLDNAFVFITDEFTNTMQVLEKYGFADLTNTKPEIESVVVQEFNPYASVNGLKEPFSMYFMAYKAESENEFIVQKDFGKQITITSEKRISSLRKVMHNNYFMSRGGYLAAVKVKGSDMWVYQFIPYSEAPDFLKRSSGEGE